MALKFYLDGRTVSIVTPYKEEQVNGTNGEYTRKSIMFKVATNHRYKSTTPDGKQEYQTDFFLVRASGKVAETFNKLCGSLKKPDGKHLSRKVLIEGTEENYTKTIIKTLKDVEIDGKLYDLQVPENVERNILIAESITFLDPHPDVLKNADGVNGKVTATLSATPSATPSASATPQASAQPVAVALQAEAEPAQPVAPVAPQPTAPQPATQMTAEEFLAGAVDIMSDVDPF